jgi:endo-1,4-beta-xylanase
MRYRFLNLHVIVLASLITYNWPFLYPTNNRSGFVINPPQKQKTLREAYKDYFPVGAAIGHTALLQNKQAADLLTSQYASITPENELKPTRLEAKQGVFTWDNADAIVNYATEHNMKVRGHTLVWPFKMPVWLYKDGNKTVSKEVLLSRLKEYIQTVVKRYKGKAYCWDVVNEAISYIPPDKLDPRIDTLYQIAGETYIEQAFVYAHEADPNARLFYNDNGEEWPQKRDKVFKFLKRMKLKGIPINGIGLQAHWGIEGIDENYLRKTIKMFADIGLEVQLTELDLSIYPKRINGRLTKDVDLKEYSDVYTQEIQKKQADMYSMIFRVCRENKGKVTGITLWSGYDWPNYLTKKYNKPNYPYLFDDQFRPKLAFRSVMNFK